MLSKIAATVSKPNGNNLAFALISVFLLLVTLYRDGLGAIFAKEPGERAKSKSFSTLNIPLVGRAVRGTHRGMDALLAVAAA
jgi:hypothetical protein